MVVEEGVYDHVSRVEYVAMPDPHIAHYVYLPFRFFSFLLDVRGRRWVVSRVFF